MALPTFPNESPEYRQSRNELLRAEVELRDLTERVAEQRRSLPLGGRVKEDYEFEYVDGSGAVKLSQLFRDKDSLYTYGFMYGPEMPQACPLCSSFLDALNANAAHIQERISIAVSARSPIERLAPFAKERSWHSLPLVSSANNSFQRDYHAESADGEQLPLANVFVRKPDGIYHYWASELLFAERPEGMDPRHIDPCWPLWNVLDCTPEGRGTGWYPSLDSPGKCCGA